MSFSFSRFRHYITYSLMVVFACGLLILNTASPALAFGGSSSSSSQGTAQMNELQQAAKQVVDAEPRSREEVQKKAKEGINEVQGSANREKMNSSKNSGNATSVRHQVEDVLDTISQ